MDYFTDTVRNLTNDALKLELLSYGQDLDFLTYLRVRKRKLQASTIVVRINSTSDFEFELHER